MKSCMYPRSRTFSSIGRGLFRRGDNIRRDSIHDNIHDNTCIAFTISTEEVLPKEAYTVS
jgi:hypothetical protein